MQVHTVAEVAKGFFPMVQIGTFTKDFTTKVLIYIIITIIIINFLYGMPSLYAVNVTKICMWLFVAELTTQNMVVNFTDC